MNQEYQDIAKKIWENTLLKERQYSGNEKLWITNQIDLFAEKNNLHSKHDVDAYLYYCIYQQHHQTEAQLLKIRYWRTGLHKPQRRDICIALSNALELSKEDSSYLIQYYYDSADIVFDEPDPSNPVYQKRVAFLQKLSEEYIWNAHLNQLLRYQISSKNPLKFIRHYFYQDALEYIYSPSGLRGTTHLESTNFSGEFKKTLTLTGEVSRISILRLLLIMNAPFISIESINQQLVFLGYAPLTPGHYTRSGAPVDDMIIMLLESYEKYSSNMSGREVCLWLKSVTKELDRLALESSKTELRPFYFKSMR